MHKYFFKPRVGADYRSGFLGLRTLVLGTYHYCWYVECPYYQDCVTAARTSEYDVRCPKYSAVDDRKYYRLSCSNVIEIDSYIEGEHYPAYDAFTHKMSGIKSYVGNRIRSAFWDKVAFYNWIQHYLPGPQEDFQYRQWEEVFLRDLPAFEEVLRELRPQVVLVWTDTLREFLDRHCASLEELSVLREQNVGMDSMEVWAYRVVHVNDMSANEIHLPDYNAFGGSRSDDGNAVSGKNKKRFRIQLRTLQKIVRNSFLCRKLAEAESVNKMAIILLDAYRHGIIDVTVDEDGCRVIVPAGSTDEMVCLIDRIRKDVRVSGTKRGLEIGEVQRLLGTDISHVPQRIHRLGTHSG